MCISFCSKPINQTYGLDALQEASIRGFYSNSFFHIYIDGEFNRDVSLIRNLKDKGTALHEYTHYIQNIGTLWGLYCSLFQYEHIIEFKKAVSNASDITRPFRFALSESLQRKKDYIKIGNGSMGYPKLMIDATQPIKITPEEVEVNGHKRTKIKLVVVLSDGSIYSLYLGAHIIKESMAALYQSILDPNAIHDDIPYNVVTLLAAQHYPETAKDIKKLICCCHISLFGMIPGAQLIDILEQAEQGPQKNGFEIFDEFVHSKEITMGKGEKFTMIEFYNIMVDGFKKMLGANLVSPLDYIATALDRVKIDGQYYPFLSVLYDNGVFSEQSFTDIIGYYGIPYIQTSKYGIHYPQGQTAAGADGSTDVLELIAQEALYRNFVDGNNMYVCPLYYMCQGSPYEKSECFTRPWEGTMCTYTIVSDYLGLANKNIV